MPDDVAGSARIRIEPDFAGFDEALEAGVQQAADQAAEAIVAAFRAAAETSAQELSSIGQAGLVDVTSTADSAATDLEAAFAAAAADADAALGTIGQGAGDEIAGQFDGIGDEISDEFVGVGAAIAGDIEAGAADAQASLEGLGSGTGDALAGEFSGVGEAISSNVNQGASEAGAGLAALEGAGQGVVEQLAQGFEGLGGIIAAVAGAVVVKGAFDAAERVQSIIGVTNTLIETTGGVANVTAAEVLALGDNLERVAGMESELVQEGANVLLTFKNVRNEVGAGNDIFNRAIAAGADLSAVLGGEITGSALQLGKALQDPIRGLSLLGRAGVSFSAEQKELVRSLVEGGDILAAQKVILGEVEGQVGGAAEASAKASDRIRESFGNLGESFGAGLLPAAEELADRFPQIVADLGPQVGELGEAIGDGMSVAVDGLLALEPVLGVTTDLLVALLPLLEAGVDIIDAIPDPVLQAAAAIYTMNKALALMRATSLLAAGGLGRLAVPAGAVSGAFVEGARTAPGFAGSLRGVTQGLSGATLAAGLGLTAVSMYSDVMAGARQEGIDFAQGIREDFDLTAMSAEELATLSGTLGTEIGNLRNQVDDSFWGRNTINKDFNESIKTGADELERFQEEVDAARKEMLRLEAEATFGETADQFVGLSDALVVVRGDSDAAADAIERFRGRGDTADDSFLALATTLGDAALSEEAMAEAARALGTDVESLQGFIDDTNAALDNFVDTAVGGLPQIGDAFRDTNDSGKVSAREFITGLKEDATELSEFFADLRVITEAGFAEVAGALAEQGGEIAGTAAEQMADAVREGNLALVLETQAGLDERDRAIAESTAFLEGTLGPDFVLATGIVAQLATEAFGANFDPQEQVRIASELAQSGLDEEGLRIAAIAATQGATAAQQFGVGLDLKQEVIDEAIAAGVAITHVDTTLWRRAGVVVGLEFGQGVAGGLRFSFADIESEAARMVNRAEAAAREAAESESPSKLFARLGEDLGAGVATGIDQSGREVVAAAEKIITDAAAAVEATASPRIDLVGAGRLAAARASATNVLVTDAAPSSAIGTLPAAVSSAPLFESLEIYETKDPEATAEAVVRRLKRERDNLAT